MITALVIAALILGGLAALLHVYIFALESLWWTSPRARTVFGMSPADAAATKGMAFNQGFYNLFLAIAVFAGIAFFLTGQVAIGATLVFVGAGSMLAASLVLLLSDRTKTSAALTQGALPLVSVVLLALGLAL